MKKLVLIFILFFSVFTQAQTEDNPIVWESSIHKISDTEYNVIFKAKLLQEWHLYSQYNPEDASQALEILIPEGKTGYKLVGKALESKTDKEYSEVWEKEEIFFKDKATITQKIEILDTTLSSITLEIYGQVCKQACIQIEESFSEHPTLVYLPHNRPVSRLKYPQPEKTPSELGLIRFPFSLSHKA